MDPYNRYQYPYQPPRKPTLWQRYRRLPAIAQLVIGLIVVLFVGSAAISGITQAASDQTAINATATQDATSSVAATPATQPTSAPTAKPTAKPTTPPAQPTPVPTQPPAPTQAPAQSNAINGNPWGYDFSPGNYITNPPADFCSGVYFSCVKSFWQSANGYVVQCGNGLYSHSGGVHGACSKDGGVANTLYSH